MADHVELALYADSDHNGGPLRQAAECLGLAVVTLPADPRHVRLAPRADLAWRAPLGRVAALAVRGTTIRLAAPTPSWFASLPAEARGRQAASVSVRDLVAGSADIAVRMVKPANAKLTTFAAAHVRDGQQAAVLVQTAALPADTALLIADQWLDCDSEYRVFRVGAQMLAWSPYVVEGETRGPLLHRHRHRASSSR